MKYITIEENEYNKLKADSDAIQENDIRIVSSLFASGMPAFELCIRAPFQTGTKIYLYSKTKDEALQAIITEYNEKASLIEDALKENIKCADGYANAFTALHLSAWKRIKFLFNPATLDKLKED